MKRIMVENIFSVAANLFGRKEPYDSPFLEEIVWTDIMACQGHGMDDGDSDDDEIDDPPPIDDYENDYENID